MARFCTIYGFMAVMLHLSGYAKEVYAVIFGFWIRYRKSVTVPYSVIKKITGATDPTISACIKYLIKRKLITADPNPGQRTRYEIVLSDEILAAYLQDCGRDDTATKVVEELNEPKYTPIGSHGTTKLRKEQKKRNNTTKMDSNKATNLTVSADYTSSSRIQTISLKKKNGGHDN